MEETYDILVADYDETIAVCMADALVGEGYRVLPCMPSALTVDLIEHLQPALLIAELRPGDSAPTSELLGQIRRHAATSGCAILLTSTDRRLLEAEGRGLGHATLSKPYQLDCLLDCVSQTLSQARDREVCQ